MVLEVGEKAPEFSLTDAQGEQISLADLLGQSKAGVVVYFYPKAMTPGCTTEACDFRDSLVSLKAAGYAVVGVSPDKQASLQKFAVRDSLPFPLLSDPDHVVMQAYGAYGEKKNYGRIVQGVIRSTFVINPDGTIKLAKYNVKATGHVSRLRRELGLD